MEKQDCDNCIHQLPKCEQHYQYPIACINLKIHKFYYENRNESKADYVFGCNKCIEESHNRDPIIKINDILQNKLVEVIKNDLKNNKIEQIDSKTLISQEIAKTNLIDDELAQQLFEYVNDPLIKQSLKQIILNSEQDLYEKRKAVLEIMYKSKYFQMAIENILQHLIPSDDLDTLNLSFYNYKFDATGFNQIVSRLQQLNSLKYLTLELKNKQLFDQSQGFEKLGSYLENAVSLQSLDLDISFNRIVPAVVKQLGSSLEKLQNLKSLTIQFYFNQVGDEGLTYLGNSITQIVNLELLNLGLKANQISSVGVIQLGQSIEKLRNLVNLSLDLISNKTVYEGIKQFGISLQNQSPVKAFKISFYCLNDDDNIMNEFGNSLSKMTYLNSLNLIIAGNIRGQAAINLGTQLSKMSSLIMLEIELNETFIGAIGIQGLQKQLNKMPNLKHLNLSLRQNDINEEVAKKTWRNFKKFKKLIVLKMNSCY